MAKYDTAKVVYATKEDEGRATIEVVILFEDNDDIDSVLTQAITKVEARVRKLKDISQKS